MYRAITAIGGGAMLWFYHWPCGELWSGWLTSIVFLSAGITYSSADAHLDGSTFIRGFGQPSGLAKLLVHFIFRYHKALLSVGMGYLVDQLFFPEQDTCKAMWNEHESCIFKQFEPMLK